MIKKNKLSIVGVSIGKPDFQTRIGYDIINKAKVLVVPYGDETSIVGKMIGGLADDKIIIKSKLENLEKRSQTDVAAKMKSYFNLGYDICYICLGDPSLYSSAKYIYNSFKSDCEIEIIPAISSMQYALSKVKSFSICNSRSLSIIPASTSSDIILSHINIPNSEFIFIKLSSNFLKIYDLLYSKKLISTSHYFQNLSMLNEKIQPLSEISSNYEPPYFSMIHTKNSSDE